MKDSQIQYWIINAICFVLPVAIYTICSMWKASKKKDEIIEHLAKMLKNSLEREYKDEE